MGGGDMRMCAAVGLFLGIKGGLFFMFTWMVIGGIVAIALIVTGRRRRRDPVPTGVFYALGLACVLLLPSLPDRYLDSADPSRSHRQSPISIAPAGGARPDGFGAGIRDVR